MPMRNRRRDEMLRRRRAGTCLRPYVHTRPHARGAARLQAPSHTGPAAMPSRSHGRTAALAPAIALLIACVSAVQTSSALPAAGETPAGNAAAAPAMPEEVIDRKVERTMLVLGIIEVDPAGQVLRYTLDHRDKLPPGIVAVVDRSVPLWRFEPVELPEGQRFTRSRMSLRFLARQTDDGAFVVSLASASFRAREEGQPETDRIRPDRSPPITYPAWAARLGVSGTVYVALRVGPDGKPRDAMVRKVNLRVKGSDGELQLWRQELARETLRHIKRRTFHVPTTGPDAGKSEWTGTLPVDYVMPGQSRSDSIGRWDAYLPGPETPIPWLDVARQRDMAPPDALPPGSFHDLEEHRQLQQAEPEAKP